MYLSRFYINAARRGSRKLLGSPQAMHAAVLASFPPQSEPSDKGRILWRLDQESSCPTLYVVSPELPDMSHLVEQAGWPATSQWESKDYEPFLRSLRVGEQFGFRIAVNPIRRSASDRKGDRGKVFPIGSEVEQLNWMLARAQQLGVEFHVGSAGIPDVRLTARRRLGFNRKGKRVTISKTEFEGRFQIVEANALREILTCGIGRAKGYGCGLMTLVPI